MATGSWASASFTYSQSDLSIGGGTMCWIFLLLHARFFHLDDAADMPRWQPQSRNRLER